MSYLKNKVSPVHDDLGEAEVDELEVAAAIEEQVLRLEVAVDVPPLVQVLERRGDARRVEGSVDLVQDGVALRGEGLGVSS